MQPQILVLKEGTENAQGKQQVISNINACQAIVDAIRTTLGPRGMDKLIVDNRGKATISNDGATIMKVKNDESFHIYVALFYNALSFQSSVTFFFQISASGYRSPRSKNTSRHS